MRLILASSSNTRKALLKRLFGNSFQVSLPEIDETPLFGEQPPKLAERLSKKKAIKIAKLNHDAIVIGSDQVAFCDGKILEKSSNIEEIYQQITWQVGKETKFYTGVAVVKNGGDEIQHRVVMSKVIYRDQNYITEKLIHDYIANEKPINCAGSTKFEGPGVCFIKRVETDDPSALMGLPLITLCTLLSTWNIRPFFD